MFILCYDSVKGQTALPTEILVIFTAFLVPNCCHVLTAIHAFKIFQFDINI